MRKTFVYWGVSLVIGILLFQLPDQGNAQDVKVNGRIMNDWTFLSPDDGLEDSLGTLVGGTEFRRVWVGLSGNAYHNVKYRVRWGFQGSGFGFYGVWLAIQDLPAVGELKLGQFKEPFGLVELTSSKYLTFLERGLITSFTPSWNVGIMVQNGFRNGQGTWAFGMFHDADGAGKAQTEENYNFTGRVTSVLWEQNEGKHLLHVGGSYSYRNPVESVARYSERPEVHITSRFVDTGTFTADKVQLFGGETAVVYDRFSVQGEYILTNVNSATVSDPSFSSAYVQGSYFLTSDHRWYKHSNGSFTRVKPEHSVGDKSGGQGAWEIAVRYSHLNLTDGLVDGGVLNNISVAVNWYLNPHTRIMLNYVTANRDQVGKAGALMFRAQVDF